MVLSMSRRSLLHGAGGLVVAGSAGVISSGIAAATVDPKAWDGLRRRLQGALVLSGEPDYGSAKKLFDSRFDGNAPVGVVRVAVPEDVRVAVTFARDHGLPIAARSGGHSFVGASATTGALVVDVRALDGVTVDADRVTVGAGITTFAAQSELSRSGLALPTGTCHSLGLVGLTLGGGLGVDARRYGMTCDRLVAADLVLPNGDPMRASATEAPEVFWMLRGAGGATGIVTSLTYRAIPATSKDVVRLTFPGDRAARVLTGWAQWMPAADRAVYARVDIVAADGIRCEVLIVCPAGAGARTAAELIAAAATTPTAQDERTLSHLDAMRDIGRDKPTPGMTRVAGADVVEHLSPAVADVIVDAITDRSRVGASGLVSIEPIDGAIRDTAPGATAFPWRSHAAAVEWIVRTPDPPAEAHRWIGSANRALGPHSAGGYLNHVQPGDTVDRCFAHNRAQVQIMRRALDPERRLRWGIDV